MSEPIIVQVSWSPEPFSTELREDNETITRWAREVFGLRDQGIGPRWVKETVLEVCTALLVYRMEAMRAGPHRLTALSQTELSAFEDLRPSQVSRVVGNVILRTPDGDLSPDQLFSGAVGDNPVSKLQLGLLVFALARLEPGASDQVVMSKLGEQGIQVARRTVAKSREDLGLPSGRARQLWDDEAWSDAIDGLVAALPCTPMMERQLRAWLDEDLSIGDRVAQMTEPAVLARLDPTMVAAEDLLRVIAGTGRWSDLSDAERKRWACEVVGCAEGVVGSAAADHA
jgi:hypothetical protein